jgi:ribonucleoside-diphosphate reductase alpha chain
MIAVCNLARSTQEPSKTASFDTAKLEKSINTAVRMLDNVIDINYYSVPQARNPTSGTARLASASWVSRTRCLYLQHIPYGSDAVEFADKSMEAVSYYAIQASVTWPTSAAATRPSSVRCKRHSAARFADPHRAARLKYIIIFE